MIAAEVYLWGTRIGIVYQDDFSDPAKFSYDKNFIRSAIELSPIVMPLNQRIYSFPALNQETFHLLPGLLADSLPDRFGTKLIEKYLERQGRTLSTLSAVERLLYTGKRGMGALEYRPAAEDDFQDKSIDIEELVELANDVLSDREKIHLKQSDDTMETILKIGSSAGGARAKALVAWNRKTGDIRSGTIDELRDYEYWIIKFDGINSELKNARNYTKIEYAYYLMAKEAGINMSDCVLYQERDKFHFMTKRFDRNKVGKKLHMQTLGAIAHFDYNKPRQYSYEETSDIMYKMNLPQSDIEEFFRRAVFNILARNQDDHVKNISFLMDKSGTWRLSPAYDVTYSYDPNNYWLKRHQMTLQGKVENFTKEDLINCAKYMNISKTRANNIIKEVQNAVFAWEKFALEAQTKYIEAQEIKKNLLFV